MMSPTVHSSEVCRLTDTYTTWKHRGCCGGDLCSHATDQVHGKTHANTVSGCTQRHKHSINKTAAYLKKRGWCVMLLSCSTFLLSLWSCSILCFCSSAPSVFPSSNSLDKKQTNKQTQQEWVGIGNSRNLVMMIKYSTSIVFGLSLCYVPLLEMTDWICPWRHHGCFKIISRRKKRAQEPRQFCCYFYCWPVRCLFARYVDFYVLRTNISRS